MSRFGVSFVLDVPLYPRFVFVQIFADVVACAGSPPSLFCLEIMNGVCFFRRSLRVLFLCLFVQNQLLDLFFQGF